MTGLNYPKNWAILFWCVSLPVWPTPVQVWSDVNKRWKTKCIRPKMDCQRFILLPALARKRFKTLIAAQDTFTAFSEASPYNAYFDGPNKELGIITTGIAFNYLSENYPDGFEHPVLKISQYPLPRKMVEKIVRECKEILVLEEGYP